MNVISNSFWRATIQGDGFPGNDPDELYQWQFEGQDLVLLDIRPSKEHAFATILGSRSLTELEISRLRTMVCKSQPR